MNGETLASIGEKNEVEFYKINGALTAMHRCEDSGPAQMLSQVIALTEQKIGLLFHCRYCERVLMVPAEYTETGRFLPPDLTCIRELTSCKIFLTEKGRKSLTWTEKGRRHSHIEIA